MVVTEGVDTRLVLASASVSRATMLKNAGVRFEQQPALGVDEAAIKQSFLAEGASAGDIADALAEVKALSVSRQWPEALVIGADQILVCCGNLFSKPSDRNSAADALRALSGQTHNLFSAVVIAESGRPVWRHLDRATLHMRELSEVFIESYLDQVGDTALQNVGCYQIEGLGSQLFSRIDGDYFTILGMPLIPALDYLRVRGMLTA